MKKSLIGWMNKEDFELYEKMMEKDGVTHIDIFRNNPEINPDDFPVDFPVSFIKVYTVTKELK